MPDSQPLEDDENMDCDIAELVHSDVPDTLSKIDDTTYHPYNAIARMRMTHFNRPNPSRGTGFLTDGYLLITAAHCVRDYRNNNCNANKVDLYFGLDQDDNASQVKRFQLEGRDFTVPNLYRKPMDPFDIAWIDMKMYFDGKSANGLPIDWCLNDLPSPGLIKAKVPDSDTGILGPFSLSGNL